MIKEYRIKNNLTQEELAEKLNISWRHLQRLEKEEDKTTIRTFKKIIAVLNIPTEDVLAYLNDKTPIS